MRNIRGSRSSGADGRCPPIASCSGSALRVCAAGGSSDDTRGMSAVPGDESADIRQLLREIRDTQREQLAEYRRATERSFELQQRAVGRQEQLGQFYRRLMLAGGALVALLLVLLVYLLLRWAHYLF